MAAVSEVEAKQRWDTAIFRWFIGDRPDISLQS